MKNILLVLIINIVYLNLQGQTLDIKSGTKTSDHCVALLTEADKFYQEGFYDKCIASLEEVIKNCSLSKSEKEHAMELLSKAYIETESRIKADSVVNKMLIRFPHYELKEAENSEGYNRLVRKYKVRPQLSIGARNTALWMYFKTTGLNTQLDGHGYSEPYEHISYGFMYYGWGEIEFDRGISINGDLIFQTVRYDRYIKKEPGYDIHFWESDEYTHIPIYIKKYFPIGKNVLPYVTAGMSWRYMMSTNANAYNSYIKADSITGKDVNYIKDIYNVNMLEVRNKTTFDWLAGVGIGYKLKNLRIFLDVRYYGGLNSFTNTSKRMSNTSMVDEYFYVDNSVKVSQFEIGASISYTLINSVKKKKY